MSDDRLAQARSQLPGWVARVERNYVDLAEMVDAPVAESRRDPMV